MKKFGRVNRGVVINTTRKPSNNGKRTQYGAGGQTK